MLTDAQAWEFAQLLKRACFSDYRGCADDDAEVYQTIEAGERIRSTLTAPTPKQQAHALNDALPDDATWTELAYRLEVRAGIEEGLADVKAGRVVSTAELRREFNLPE